MARISSRLNRRLMIILVITLCAIILTSSLTYFYYINFLGVKAPRAKNVIAIMRIEGAIIYPDVANAYADAINHAVRNDTIKAVVLVIDSPGGEVTLIEQIYMNLLELKRKKPLISSIISALSGGYYMAVASDYIYVLPSSNVGNIGVIAQGPPIQPPSEQILETGAYKLSGFSKLSFLHDIDTVLNNFISAVENSRGSRLKLSEAELKKARIYTGVKAVSVGLADEMGSVQKAVEKAAQEANVTEYDVIDLTDAAPEILQQHSSNASYAWKGITLETLSKVNPPPAIYYLYLPPRNVAANITLTEARMEKVSEGSITGEGERIVLIDLSHGNKVSRSELDMLIWELIKRNITTRFVVQQSELKTELSNATALIIALPTATYSDDELEEIKAFVSGGGILLLIYDPAKEYSITTISLEAINSIANAFKLFFAGGYLYNEEEYYGIYRNIRISNLASNTLTQNISSLIFFTATHIRSEDHGIAWAPENTHSSQSERTGKYPVVVFSENNGTVIAIGDVTFLMEPYCYLEDNYKLISNLAAYIAS